MIDYSIVLTVTIYCDLFFSTTSFRGLALLPWCVEEEADAGMNGGSLGVLVSFELACVKVFWLRGVVHGGKAFNYHGDFARETCSQYTSSCLTALTHNSQKDSSGHSHLKNTFIDVSLETALKVRLCCFVFSQVVLTLCCSNSWTRTCGWAQSLPAK